LTSPSPSSQPLPPQGDFWRALPASLEAKVEAFDRRADKELERLRADPRTDRLLYAATELGDYSLLWHLITAARGLRSDRDAADAVRIAVILGAESVLVNGVIKSLFRRTRPAWEQERTYRIRRPRSSSFPSGHASSGFTAAALLSETDRGLRPLWYATAAVVATSRAHVRIHHASDVIGGVVTGLVLGRIARRLWPAPIDGDPFSGIRNRSRR
jgi:membrane-associated phospholipid phosphatase